MKCVLEGSNYGMCPWALIMTCVLHLKRALIMTCVLNKGALI